MSGDSMVYARACVGARACKVCRQEGADEIWALGWSGRVDG